MIDYTILNPAQQDAVFSGRDRILCLAGAGTGKTRVLTHRMGRLYEGGVSPENMLALTFTRAAGAEMKGRVVGLIGAEGRKLFCNTFHAWCAEVIREYAEEFGYDKDFSIYDQADADGLLAGVLAEMKYGVTPEQVWSFRDGKTQGLSVAAMKQAERTLSEYCYRLKRNNAFDFDSLIGAIYDELDAGGRVSGRLRTRYTHVFVDEFQDTDPTQWAIVKMLNPDNLFIVGDDFQSIYGFRGSDINIILALAGDPAWHTIKLEQNYRSTEPVVAAANRLIRHNRQTEKILITDRAGAAVEFREPADDEAEITELVDRLKTNQAPGREKTTAIIARTNKQVNRAKSILEARGVVCESSNRGDNPLTSAPAKVLFALMAAIENPADDVAARSAAAVRMGNASILEAERRQLETGGSFFDALNETNPGALLVASISGLADACKELKSVTEVAGLLLREYVETELKVIDYHIVAAIDRWETRQAELGEPATVGSLLEWIRLTGFADTAVRERTPDRTYIMTAHGSKGLEFDEVFIIGAAQGVFPSRGDLEEERRLFYVAMTRAREHLNISCPAAVSGWNGQLKPAQRSQFVSEAQPQSIGIS